MNKILFISLILFISCKNTKTTKIFDSQQLPLATVKMEKSEGKESIFFSTVQGKMIILCDGEGASLMDSFLREKGTGFRELGVGNAFFMKNDVTRLCTAKHAAVGLEKETFFEGGDVAMISTNLKVIDEFLKSNPKIYSKGDYQEGDSVFVTGSILYHDRKIYDVSICGTGEVFDLNDIKKVVPILNNENEQFADGKSIWLRLEQNIDLGGLSGAPAFNKKGQVIGLFSGRNGAIYQSDTIWSIRIALLR